MRSSAQVSVWCFATSRTRPSCSRRRARSRAFFRLVEENPGPGPRPARPRNAGHGRPDRAGAASGALPDRAGRDSFQASERQADVRAAIDQGASGFIPKSSSAPVLLAALRLIVSGGVYVPPLVLEKSMAVPAPAPPRPLPPDRASPRTATLTPRQLEVLALLGKGLTNRAQHLRLPRYRRGDREGAHRHHLRRARRREPHGGGGGPARAESRLGPSRAAELASVGRPEGPHGLLPVRRRVLEHQLPRPRPDASLRDSKGLRYLAYLLRHGQGRSAMRSR